MKRILFGFLVVLLTGCNANPIDEPSSDENYIKILSTNPPKGTVIDKATWINAEIEYNVLQNETEGNGFYLTCWSTYGKVTEKSQWHGTGVEKYDLSKRNNQLLKSVDYIYNISESDTIHYRISISRKKTETTGTILVYSEVFSYVVGK